MPNTRIKVSIFLNYFLFAILLNSVGTVILQVQRFFSVAESSASILEACKDISIAVASFLVASFITRIGYKKSMLIALGLMTVACFIIPSVQTFIAIKILFIVTGTCFGLTKVSVFGTIGLITKQAPVTTKRIFIAIKVCTEGMIKQATAISPKAMSIDFL